MNIYLLDCSDPALATTLALIYKIFQLICIIVPILLIVMLAVDAIRMMSKPEDEKKLFPILKKILLAVLVFFLPTILQLCLNIVSLGFSDSDNEIFNFTECFKQAIEVNEQIGDANYNSGAGTQGGNGNLFGDLDGLSEYDGGSSSNIDKDTILAEAQKVADYVYNNNFHYGDAPINPAMDSSARLVSCDRYVGWVLYNLGYTDQPRQQGLTVRALPEYLEEHGFTKITSYSEINTTDIIFFDYGNDGSVDHVFILGEKGNDDFWYRYDCGSEARLHNAQPSLERVNPSIFIYAYRFP